MDFLKHNSEVVLERRVAIDKLQGQSDYSLRNTRRGRRFGRIAGRRLLIWVFSLAVLFIYLSVFGIHMLHVDSKARPLSLSEVKDSFRHVVVREERDRSAGDDVSKQARKLRRARKRTSIFLCMNFEVHHLRLF